MRLERLPKFTAYDYQLTVGRWLLKWRWLPIIQYRFLPRAWQATAPDGFVASWSWTGRDRELIGWFWPIAVERISKPSTHPYAPAWSWEAPK